MPTKFGAHRCRFVDYTPSAVTALAFSPLPLPPPDLNKLLLPVQSFGHLFVGHANGNVDVCLWSGSSNSSKSHQAWTTQKTLVGPNPSKVDSLVAVLRDPQDPDLDKIPDLPNLRLFSSGSGSNLLEWNLTGCSIRRSLPSQGGAIWSLAANPSHSHLAIGCEDGVLRLIAIHDDKFIHLRSFNHVKARTLCIAWGPPKAAKSATRDDDDDEPEKRHWADSWLVTGSSDSSIRKWDVASGRVLDRMRVEKFKGERTLVWSLTVLSDGTIVSGDSLGHIRFWDSRTCTQLQSFKGHGADVLSITTSADGNAIYSSGVDQRITQFSPVSMSSQYGKHSRWVQTVSRRLHSHDVRSLAMWPPCTILPSTHRRPVDIHLAPILASGGLDMSVLLTPAASTSSTVVKIQNPLLTGSDCTFEEARHRRIAYPCGPANNSSTFIVSPSRLLFAVKDTSVSTWHLPDNDADGEVDDEPELVLDMHLNVKTNILSSAVSPDGSRLVVSDAYESKLFAIEMKDGVPQPQRNRSLTTVLRAALGEGSMDTGASQCAFTPDSKKLVLVGATYPCVMVLDVSEEEPTLLRAFSPSQDGKPKAQRMSLVFRMAISPDGQWLVIFDENGRATIYNLDALQQHCTLPKFPKQVQALSFDASSPNMLILAFPDNTIELFDVETRQFPQMLSVQNGVKEVHDPVIGIRSWISRDNTEDRGIFVWGSTWITRLGIDSRAGPHKSGMKRGRHVKSALPSSEETATAAGSVHPDEHGDAHVFRRYRPILNLDFLADGDIVVIERPLSDVLATLTPPYFTEKYGKT